MMSTINTQKIVNFIVSNQRIAPFIVIIIVIIIRSFDSVLARHNMR
jgi:ABC-type methionine transport system permease subunit